MRFAQDGRTLSKGYGFVDFSARSEAQAAIEALNGKNVLGKTLKVGFAKPSGQRVKSNLFVSQIPTRWTDIDLEKEFGKYGTIIERRILRKEDGDSRCSGFVRFDNNEQASKALATMNMWRPSMLDKPLLVRIATDNETRMSSQKKESRTPNESLGNHPQRNSKRNKSKFKSKRQSTKSTKAKSSNVTRAQSTIPETRGSTPSPNFHRFPRPAPVHQHPRAPVQNFRGSPAQQTGPSPPRSPKCHESSRNPYVHSCDFRQTINPRMHNEPTRHPSFSRTLQGFKRHMRRDYGHNNRFNRPAFESRANTAPPAEYQAKYCTDQDIGWEDIYQDPSFLREDKYDDPNIFFARENNYDPPKPVPKEPPIYQRGEFEVHMVNFPLVLDKAAIMNMCSVYGTIKDVRLASDNNGRSLRLATLVFDNEETAQRVIEAFDGCTIGGFQLNCSPSCRV